MTTAFVLLTAMPPTYGHLDLMRFAYEVSGGDVTVILNTQPDEPLPDQRYQALVDASHSIGKGIRIRNIHKTLPQEPEGNPGFWDMWVGFLKYFDFREGDYIVASELYGVKLAEVARGRFLPYDLERTVRHTKATMVRDNYIYNWDQMIPEFRKHLQKKITIFGAESTGKTTLSRLIRHSEPENVTALPEWARPYLEAVGPELTVGKMDAIHLGQKSLQRTTYKNALKPIVVQDTDLFSTLGYWRNWDRWSVPENLAGDAFLTRSDLYIVTLSNIPFEADPLRYGGDKRELDDQYWIDLLDEYNLPYVVLQGEREGERMYEAWEHIDRLTSFNPLTYQRIGAEYLTDET